MDINAFKTFLEVAKIRHFGHAANNLFITQSAVSARIKLLEDNLGVKLFNRDRGNLHLTYDGELLLSYAKTILSTWERARQEIGMPAGVRTNLLVGALPGLWELSLQPWLSKILLKQQDLSLNTEVQNLKLLVDRVINRSMDIAFIFDAPLHQQLLSKPLRQLELRMVSKDKGVTVDEAISSNYIFVDWGTSFSIEHAKTFPGSIARLHTATSHVAYKHIYEHGGSAYLAKSMIADAIKKQRLYYVKTAPIFKRQAFAIYHADNEHIALIENILTHL